MAYYVLKCLEESTHSLTPETLTEVVVTVQHP